MPVEREAMSDQERRAGRRFDAGFVFETMGVSSPIPLCTCQNVAGWTPGQPFAPCTDCNHPDIVRQRQRAELEPPRHAPDCKCSGCYVPRV